MAIVLGVAYLSSSLSGVGSVGWAVSAVKQVMMLNTQLRKFKDGILGLNQIK